MKSQRKKIEKELDSLWRRYILLRDKKCKVCGKGINLQAHHIFSRKHKSTRWDVENGIALCSGHHLFAHQEPEEFRRKVISLVGEQKYEELYQKSRVVARFSLEELEEMKRTLEEMISEIESEE